MKKIVYMFVCVLIFLTNLGVNQVFAEEKEKEKENKIVGEVISILPNGFRVITNQSFSDAFSVKVYVKVPTYYENKRGFSHLLEHVLMEEDYGESPLDYNGVCSRAEVYKDIAKYYSIVTEPKDCDINLEDLIRFYGKILFKPRLSEKIIEAQKKIIKSEMLERYDDARFDISNLQRHLHGGEKFILRHVEDVEDDKEITREDLKNFHNKFYKPENTILVISSSLTHGEMYDLAIKYFFPSEKKKNVKKDKYIPKEKVKFVNRNENNFFIFFSALTNGKNDRIKAQYLKNLLGGELKSRLHKKIRQEMGLAYYCFSWSDSYENTGNIRSGCSVAAEDILPALSAIKDVCVKAGGNEISKQEYKRIQKTTLHFFCKNQDDRIRDLVVNNKLAPKESTEKEIKETSAEDIKKFAKEIFVPGNMFVTIIGDTSKLPAELKEKIEKELGL